MGAAEGIAGEAVRVSKPGDTLRHQLQERFAPWLDSLQTQWPERPATFLEVTAPGWAIRQQRPGGSPETIVTPGHRGEHARRQGTWPQCEGV
jgi:hypothetical protein